MMRMITFCKILRLIEKYITPIESGIKVVRAPERLTLCIRYFTTGETSLSNISFMIVFRKHIPKDTVELHKDL